MQYTTNLNLKKPDGTDALNIGDLNDNADAIDAALAQAWNRENLTLVDYIVAQGYSGNWYYRKWNSGFAECWGDISASATTFSANGSLYYTEILSFTYPFDFVSVKSRFISSYHSNIISATINGNSLTAIEFRLITTTNTASSYTNRTLKAYATGTWK